MFESMDQSAIKRFHLKITILSSAGSFLDGYDISIVSVAILLLAREFSLTTLDQTLLLGSTLIGMVFGGVFIGYLTDLKGRRYIYLLDMVLFIVFAVLTAISVSFMELLIFRLLLGVAIGADYAITPTIIAEFAPALHRGKLLTVSGLFFYIGAAISYAIGYLLIPLGEVSWRYMFLIGVIPAVMILILRASIPESPRWLVSKGRDNDAVKSMKKMGLSGTPEPQALQTRTSFRAIFTKKYIKYTIFISAIWFCLDAVTYVIALFGPTILTSLKLSPSAASGTAAVIAALAIIGAVIAFFFVDRIGRKPITYIGFSGMAVTLILAAIFLAFYPLIILVATVFVAFEISQELGPGITTSIFPQEFYPTELRSTAQGFGTTVSRVGALAGIGIYGFVSVPMGNSGGMIFLAAISLVGLAVTLIWATETKGKTLEQLTG